MTEKETLRYRKLEPADDKKIVEIIRTNLKKFHLWFPGTVYFDQEVEHSSTYYNSNPSKNFSYNWNFS